MGSLMVLGLAVGTSEVELDITGWQQRGLVQFSVTAEPAPACPIDEYADAPSFDIALADE